MCPISKRATQILVHRESTDTGNLTPTTTLDGEEFCHKNTPTREYVNLADIPVQPHASTTKVL